jgi:hypothetical protein
MSNLIKEVFKAAATTADIHFEFGSPVEVQDHMTQLGKINKTRFPALLLLNNWEEDVDRYKMSVSGLTIIMIAQGVLDESSEKSEERFNSLLTNLDDVLKALAGDNRIYGTATDRFIHKRIRRYYQNMGGVPSVAWLVTFTENNNFRNICKYDRF